ncbi:MAG: hypothetical protein LIO92_09645 [Clostridiales bacterium]|nr:hypothetical protein [Clostridiales bacterium]
MAAVYQYEDYLKKDKILSFEEARDIQKKMAEEIGTDEDALDLYKDLIETSIQYIQIRAKWSILSKTERGDLDQTRTLTHNSLIVKFNQLARYLKMQGKEASWRDQLGYEEDDKMNRKRVGDMGCFLAYVHGIHTR